MKVTTAPALAIAFAAFASYAEAQAPMRPGRWEVTMQMQMPNMPMQMPPVKSEQCVTQAQIDGPAKGLPSGSPTNPNDCKVSDYKTLANTITWKVACSGAQPMSGTGEMRFANDTYEGTMTMTMEQQQMTMKMSGKRLGDCTP
jgi:hypothetical protein